VYKRQPYIQDAAVGTGWLAQYIPTCLLTPASTEPQEPQPSGTHTAPPPPPPPPASSSLLLRALWRTQQEATSTPVVVTPPVLGVSSPLFPPKPLSKQPLDPADLLVRGLVGQTIVKAPGDLQGRGGGCGPQPFAIEDCVDCDIYVLEATAQVTVDDCVDCRIVLGPCAGSLFLRDCKGCAVVAACQQFRTRGCAELGKRWVGLVNG